MWFLAYLGDLNEGHLVFFWLRVERKEEQVERVGANQRASERGGARAMAAFRVLSSSQSTISQLWQVDDHEE